MDEIFLCKQNRKVMKLKNILFTNAISSGITGLLLTSVPEFFAKLFGVNTIVPFREVGVFLIVFALFVLLTASKSPIPKNWTQLIIALDVSWVIVRVVVVVIISSLVSIFGSIIIMTIAGWVGMMAYLQQKALNKGSV